MAVSPAERPLSFDKLRMVSLVEPFAKEGGSFYLGDRVARMAGEIFQNILEFSRKVNAKKTKGGSYAERTGYQGQFPS